jgi:DNA repair exonuclease SbcCD ATPase subunit
MKYVNFKRIAAKNFLSIGEEVITVNFTKGLHVITGNNRDKPDRRNGVGKSCVAEIVYFAIFGETLRGIKKDLIPNNVTGGKTQVELDFEVITPNSTKSYTVIRYLNPTKIQLFEEGVDITLDSTANTTKHICNTISASPAIFENCVIMTVNNAVPFMAKSKVDKRKFIEDIFGLEVFSEMSSRLRSEYNDLKKDNDSSQVKLTEITNTYNSYKQQQEQTLRSRKEKQALYLTRRTNNLVEIEELTKYIDSLTTVDVEKIKSNINEYEKGIDKCDNFISTINADIAVSRQKINDMQGVYQKIGTSDQKCAVCLRSIEEHDLAYIKEEKDKLKNEIILLGTYVKSKATSLENYSNKKLLIKNKISSLTNSINNYKLQQVDKSNKQQRLEQLTKWLEELDADLLAIENCDTTFDNLINETQERINIITTECEHQTANLNKLDIVKYIISEEGVKSYIVNKLLEILNSRLLHYLQKLDSNCICIFNEYFEEEILNEKNKVCSYFNFSGAERKAIDLACLFTFSDLRRMQGGVRYNIAIYDELFDSSFDEKGIELITNILKERVEELNEANIIISHRKESIKAVTGDVILLQKLNGVTTRIPYDEFE